MKKKIITIGEAMGLFVADEVGSLDTVSKFTKFIAGAELNVSVGLSRLGHEVYYASKVGSDPIGKSIKNFINKEKINDNFVYQSDSHVTGFQIKEKVTSGDPMVASYRKGSAASTINLNLFKDFDFSSFDFVHLSGIFLALSPETKEVSHFFADEARKHGACITFDPNIRQNLWNSKEEMCLTINELASKCDVVLPGVSEGLMLTGYSEPEDICDFYLKQNTKTVIVKLGGDGAYVKTRDMEGKYVSGFKVNQIIDTVGAGDGFAVGVISGLADGLSVEEAVTRGNAIGAIQLMSASDNEGLPTIEEINLFLENK